MSGAVSAIGKIFTPVFSGVKSVIGSAVGGVGASVATSTAAGLGASAAIGAGGGMLGTAGTSVLGSMLGGAAKIGAAVFGHGLSGTTDAAADATRGGMGSGLLGFMKDNAGLVQGLGAGIGAYEEASMKAEEAQKDRDFLLGKEQRLNASYHVDPSAVPNGASTGVVKDQARPTPAQQYSRADTPWYWQYDPQTKQTKRVPAGSIG